MTPTAQPSSAPDFRSLFEAVPGLYVALNPNFTIAAASDSYLEATLVKREDVLGKNIFEVFPDNPDDPNATGVAQLKASLERVLKNSSYDIMAIQKYDIRSEGQFLEKYWSPLNFPIFNKTGSLTHLLHTVEDATELVKLKQEKMRQSKANEELQNERNQLERLRQSQRIEAMGQLAGGVAHDFNNILATIILNCEKSMLSSEASPALRESFQQILKGSERAAALTRQLLAFSRKQVLQPKVLNLNLVAKNMQTLLKPLLNENFDLHTQLAEDLHNTLIDPGQIEQIILNLVMNAREAMPRGGKITISTSNEVLDRAMSSGNMNVEPGSYVMLCIRDTGSGMDAQTQARIFEPFFTTKAVGKGNGLGLATVYGIVTQNKGTIWVYSEPQKGSVFKVYFPVVSRDVTKEPLHTHAKVQRASTAPKKILLVEDEQDLRESVALVLEGNGYNVLQAVNGVEALKIVNENKAELDLIVTDVMMPEMGGPALAHNLAILGYKCKILFLSGYTEDVLGDTESLKTQFDFWRSLSN